MFDWVSSAPKEQSGNSKDSTSTTHSHDMQTKTDTTGINQKTPTPHGSPNNTKCLELCFDPDHQMASGEWSNERIRTVMSPILIVPIVAFFLFFFAAWRGSDRMRRVSVGVGVVTELATIIATWEDLDHVTASFSICIVAVIIVWCAVSYIWQLRADTSEALKRKAYDTRRIAELEAIAKAADANARASKDREAALAAELDVAKTKLASMEADRFNTAGLQD